MHYSGLPKRTKSLIIRSSVNDHNDQQAQPGNTLSAVNHSGRLCPNSPPFSQNVHVHNFPGLDVKVSDWREFPPLLNPLVSRLYRVAKERQMTEKDAGLFPIMECLLYVVY